MRQIKKSPSITRFHGIRMAPFHMTQVFHGIPWNIPWNRVPSDSVELGGRISNDTGVLWNSIEYSMEFHGTLVPPNEMSLSSMEFHGTLRLSFYSKTCYPGLPGDIPWNSTELWSRQIKNHRVPWESMELGRRHYKCHKCSMEFHGIFHGIPWNSGAAKWNTT